MRRAAKQCARTGQCGGAFAVGVLPLAETVNPQLLLQEPTPLDRRVEEYERQIITEALNIHQGRINEVAEYLQIPRKNFICA